MPEDIGEEAVDGVSLSGVEVGTSRGLREGPWL